MRHRNAGWKLGRKTDHRRALLRNLVTSLIEKERIVTTVPKAKALRPLAEKMITLGKAETLHARRQAAAYLKSPVSVKKLFETIAVRFGARLLLHQADPLRRLVARRIGHLFDQRVFGFLTREPRNTL